MLTIGCIVVTVIPMKNISDKLYGTLDSYYFIVTYNFQEKKN